MGLISCVTSLTADMVAVEATGDDIKVKVDSLALYLAGDTRDEQLRNLYAVACKLRNAVDDIAAQQRMFEGDQ